MKNSWVGVWILLNYLITKFHCEMLDYDCTAQSFIMTSPMGGFDQQNEEQKKALYLAWFCLLPWARNRLLSLYGLMFWLLSQDQLSIATSTQFYRLKMLLLMAELFWLSFTRPILKRSITYHQINSHEINLLHKINLGTQSLTLYALAVSHSHLRPIIAAFSEESAETCKNVSAMTVNVASPGV